jgi:hypothetical protein
MCDLKILFDITKEQQKILKFNEEQEEKISNLQNIITENKDLNIEITKKDYYEMNSEEYHNLYFKFFDKYHAILFIQYLDDKVKSENYIDYMDYLKDRLTLYFDKDIGEKSNCIFNFMTDFNSIYINIRIKNIEYRKYYLFSEKIMKIINYYIYLYITYPNHNELIIEIDKINRTFQSVNLIQTKLNLQDEFNFFFKHYLKIKFDVFKTSKYDVFDFYIKEDNNSNVDEESNGDNDIEDSNEDSNTEYSDTENSDENNDDENNVDKDDDTIDITKINSNRNINRNIFSIYFYFRNFYFRNFSFIDKIDDELTKIETLYNKITKE